MKKNNQFDIMPGMEIVEAAVQSVKIGIRRAIENIGVEIPVQTGPISEVISGKGRILPHPARQGTLRVLGSGRQRALIGYAILHPEAVIDKLNPDGLSALIDPQAVEDAFHEQLARPCLPDKYQDYLTPLAEKQLGVIEFQPDEPRVQNLEKLYRLMPGSIRPKALIDEEGKPVQVWDWVRPDGKRVGAPEFPPQAEWRAVEVPDISGAMAAKGAQELIDILGLVDKSQPFSIFRRQADVKDAVVQFAVEGKIGLSPDLLGLTVAAFMFAAEHPEIAGSDTISKMIKNRNDLTLRRTKRSAVNK